MVFALSAHFLFLFYFSTLLIKESKDTTPEIKSVMITISYKEPESVQKQIKKKIISQPIPKKKLLPPEVKKVIAVSPKKKNIKRIKNSAEKKTITPVKTVPKKRISIKRAKEIQPKKELLEKMLQTVQNKSQQKTVQYPYTETDTFLKKIKKLDDKAVQKPLQNIKGQRENLIRMIDFADPEYKNNPPPIYPKKARKRGYEGLIELFVLISIDGRASHIKIKKSTGHKMLDKQAIKTVKKWTFEPRKNNGQAIETWVMIPMRFKLN